MVTITNGTRIMYAKPEAFFLRVTFTNTMISVSTLTPNTLCLLYYFVERQHNMEMGILPSLYGRIGESGMEYVNMKLTRTDMLHCLIS